MTALADFLRDTAQAAVAPGVLTTAAVSLAGYLEDANAAAPLNAVSHIPYGEKRLSRTNQLSSTRPRDRRSMSPPSPLGLPCTN
jgi:hypothetical protein